MRNIQFYSGAIDAGECISNGWNLVRPNYWLYFGVTVLAILLILLTSCIPCLNFFLIGPVGVGVYYVLLKGMRAEPVDFAMMFKGFEKFVPAMATGLIQSIPSIIWTVIDLSVNLTSIIAELGTIGNTGTFYQSDSAAVPFLAGLTVAYVALGLFFLVVSVLWHFTFIFALPLLAEHDLGPIEALKLSASAAWGNVGGLALLFLLQIGIALVGVLALCIGIFFVVPILYAATAFAYRQAFPLMDQQQMNLSPPPPTEYGNFSSGM